MSLTEYGLTAAGSMSATGSGRSSFTGLAYWSADLSNPLVPFDAVKVETAVGELRDEPWREIESWRLLDLRNQKGRPARKTVRPFGTLCKGAGSDNQLQLCISVSRLVTIA